jgi:hypothetical protein
MDLNASGNSVHVCDKIWAEYSRCLSGSLWGLRNVAAHRTTYHSCERELKNWKALCAQEPVLKKETPKITVSPTHALSGFK